MEYACRGDLTYYLPSTSHITTKDEKIQHISAVKNIIYQVVQGLEEIHKLGYVYRDLKPANILINHSGKIKLCDFGLVAPLGVIDSSVCGTP
jgi:serine/threonine protein kinase